MLISLVVFQECQVEYLQTHQEYQDSQRNHLFALHQIVNETLFDHVSRTSLLSRLSRELPLSLVSASSLLLPLVVPPSQVCLVVVVLLLGSPRRGLFLFITAVVLSLLVLV